MVGCGALSWTTVTKPGKSRAWPGKEVLAGAAELQGSFTPLLRGGWKGAKGWVRASTARQSRYSTYQVSSHKPIPIWYLEPLPRNLSTCPVLDLQPQPPPYIRAPAPSWPVVASPALHPISEATSSPALDPPTLTLQHPLALLV